MNKLKNMLGLGKKPTPESLANADNGRFLCDIEAKEYQGNNNIRDTNEIVEINLEAMEGDDDDDDDDACPLLDGDFVLVKYKRGLRFLACIREHDDVADNTVRINPLGRKNLCCGANDLVSVSPYPPEQKEGQPKETLHKAVKVVFQAINEEGLEDFEGDIAKTFLEPYYFNVGGNFDMGRPVTTGVLIRSNAAMTDGWFKIKEILGPNGKKLDYATVSWTSEGHPENTILELDPVPISMEDGEGDLNRIGYADIGGLGDQLTQIRELIELPIRHPKLFTTIGVRPPKGVLMHGPPGTGKTLIAKAVANETGCTFRTIAGPEVMSGRSGEAEKKIRSFFEEARENAPAIIFIDEIDAMAPNREKTQDETLRRMVATLLTEMDGMDNDAHIMVIGATNRPNALDPALRRAGRFDSELVIGVPSEEGRREILGILTRKQKLDTEPKLEDGVTVNPEYVDLDKLANVTMGFVGADLANLCSKAAISCITKASADIDLEADVLPVEFYKSLKMGMTDFMQALPDVPPSALKEFVVAKPSVTFDDIGGLEDVKRELMEMIEFGKDDDGYFDDMGINAPSGCMFYGPPGCGKTLLAKAMANEMESNFISIKGPELSSKWFGESEENMRNIFTKGRQASPCILFFDEMDSIAAARGNGGSAGVGDRVVNQLLTEMDGVGARKDLFVIGASNMITLMDPAVMRNGRLDQLVYIPMPDLEARKAIFRANLRQTPIADNVNTDLLAEHTEGYSGADISGICQTAVKLVVRKRLFDVKEALRNIPLEAKEARKKATMEINKTPLLITHECFEIAKNQSKASITPQEHNKYLAQRSKMSEQSASGSGSMGMSQDDQNLEGKFLKVTAGGANQDELENLYASDSDED